MKMTTTSTPTQKRRIQFNENWVAESTSFAFFAFVGGCGQYCKCYCMINCMKYENCDTIESSENEKKGPDKCRFSVGGFGIYVRCHLSQFNLLGAHCAPTHIHTHCENHGLSKIPAYFWAWAHSNWNWVPCLWVNPFLRIAEKTNKQTKIDETKQNK